MMSEAIGNWVRDVGEADFESQVLDGSKEQPVIVDFWAPWCQPCVRLSPLLERLVNERKGEVILAKVNVDEAPGLASAFRIASIPTVLAFRDGQAVSEFQGSLPEAQLRAFLDRVGPSEADRLVARAKPLEASNPQEAETLYRQVLERDRGNEAGILGLARLLVQRGQDDEVQRLLENSGFQGERATEAERLGAIIFLHKLARDLPDEKTARRRAEAEPKSGQRRYELGCVLAAAGKYQDALESLLGAAELDPRLAGTKVREGMVQLFFVVGARSKLADEYRNRLSTLLY
jgi:putative thioredoxin